MCTAHHLYRCFSVSKWELRRRRSRGAVCTPVRRKKFAMYGIFFICLVGLGSIIYNSKRYHNFSFFFLCCAYAKQNCPVLPFYSLHNRMCGNLNTSWVGFEERSASGRLERLSRERSSFWWAQEVYKRVGSIYLWFVLVQLVRFGVAVRGTNKQAFSVPCCPYFR